MSKEEHTQLLSFVPKLNNFNKAPELKIWITGLLTQLGRLMDTYHMKSLFSPKEEEKVNFGGAVWGRVHNNCQKAQKILVLSINCFEFGLNASSGSQCHKYLSLHRMSTLLLVFGNDTPYILNSCVPFPQMIILPFKCCDHVGTACSGNATDTTHYLKCPSNIPAFIIQAYFSYSILSLPFQSN